MASFIHCFCECPKIKRSVCFCFGPSKTFELPMIFFSWERTKAHGNTRLAHPTKRASHAEGTEAMPIPIQSSHFAYPPNEHAHAHTQTTETKTHAQTHTHKHTHTHTKSHHKSISGIQCREKSGIAARPRVGSITSRLKFRGES